MLYYTKANYKRTMTKRPHLTVEEVLESVLSDEEDADNQEELCDPEEPIMEGSDDEFSDINGYFSKFDVYTGRKETRECGLGAHVKKLTEDLKQKNHHVFFDNYFTSYKLMEDLEKEGILACGTARKDRKKFPSALKNPGLKKR